jgi:hypothetical protein
MQPWIGDSWKQTGILILGESWYDNEVKLEEYIPNWINKGQSDYLFSRIFNVCSGFHTSNATLQQREIFWSKIIFHNFVNWSVGKERKDRPKPDDYLLAKRQLPEMLREIMPRKIWLLGKEQIEHSKPIVESLGIKHEVAPHPCGWGVKTETLKASWAKLF